MGRKTKLLKERVTKILRISIVKSIYINFKCLPFNQAISFPILIGRGTILRDLSGCIEIKAPIKIGMISFGIFHIFNSDNSKKTIITNTGKIIFRGKIIFQSGIVLHTFKTGQIDFGNRIWLGIHSSIVSRKRITIGNNVRMSWNVQIIDTDFHYIVNVADNSVRSNTKEIVIENNCWLANHVSLSKGSVIAEGSIVGSFSSVKKNFMENRNSIIVGNPAKIIREGFSQVIDAEIENYYDKLHDLA